MDLLRCNKCGLDKDRRDFYGRPGSRGVSYTCILCCGKRDRKQEVFNRQFRKLGAVCLHCGRPKKLASRTDCPQCLRKRGLRVCPKCQEVLLIDLDFPAGGKECLICAGGVKMHPKCDICDKVGIIQRKTMTLCATCNSIYGLFKSDPVGLHRVSEYLLNNASFATE